MPKHDMLWKRLESGNIEELRKISQIFSIKNSNRMSKDSLIEELSIAIRHAAGHAVANLFRDKHKYEYKQLLIDVASKMNPEASVFSWSGYNSQGKGINEIEDDIWKFYNKIAQKKLKDASNEEKEKLRKDVEKELRRLGYGSALTAGIGASIVGGTAATIIAPALALNIALATSSGLTWLGVWWVGAASSSLVVGTGAAVASAVVLPVGLWWLGNTAYRKTVPAVIQLITIRKLKEAAMMLGDL